MPSRRITLFVFDRFQYSVIKSKKRFRETAVAYPWLIDRTNVKINRLRVSCRSSTSQTRNECVDQGGFWFLPISERAYFLPLALEKTVGKKSNTASYSGAYRTQSPRAKSYSIVHGLNNENPSAQRQSSPVVFDRGVSILHTFDRIISNNILVLAGITIRHIVCILTMSRKTGARHRSYV